VQTLADACSVRQGRNPAALQARLWPLADGQWDSEPRLICDCRKLDVPNFRRGVEARHRPARRKPTFKRSGQRADGGKDGSGWPAALLLTEFNVAYALASRQHALCGKGALGRL
jgi:hypothetical protein